MLLFSFQFGGLVWILLDTWQILILHNPWEQCKGKGSKFMDWQAFWVMLIIPHPSGGGSSLIWSPPTPSSPPPLRGTPPGSPASRRATSAPGHSTNQPHLVLYLSSLVRILASSESDRTLICTFLVFPLTLCPIYLSNKLFSQSLIALCPLGRRSSAGTTVSGTDNIPSPTDWLTDWQAEELKDGRTYWQTDLDFFKDIFLLSMLSVCFSLAGLLVQDTVNWRTFPGWTLSHEYYYWHKFIIYKLMIQWSYNFVILTFNPAKLSALAMQLWDE